MEASFSFTPNNDTTFLQKVPVDIRASYTSVKRKTDSDELAKATRVVVPLSLRVSKCLKNRVCLEYLALQKAESTFGIHR
jgi:hypothetical protein